MSFDEYKALDLAVEAAKKSPCSKSKRGVVVWGGYGTNPLRGCNTPPPGFTCDGSDACRKGCRDVCVHAEVAVLLHTTSEYTDLLHVKVVNGEPVPSGPPSCVRCSAVILQRGLVRVWLLEETGLRLYSAEDFHVQSLLHGGLPVIRTPREDNQ